MNQQPDPAYSETIQINSKEICIEFTHHACDRMKQRRIKIEDVLGCLKRPDEKTAADEEGKRRFKRMLPDGSKIVTVVFKIVDESRYRIVTAF